MNDCEHGTVNMTDTPSKSNKTTTGGNFITL